MNLNLTKEMLILSLQDALVSVKKDIQSFECLNDLLDTVDKYEPISKASLSALLESLIQKLSLDVDYLAEILADN